MLQTVPLSGYAPDSDPSAPGVFSYCLGVEPTLRGWKLVRSRTTSAATSGAAFASGSYILDGFIGDTADGTTVFYLAIYDQTAAKVKLYRVNGAALTDTSQAGSYSASSANFVFCQYGNYTLATNLIDVVQIRDASGSGAFADSAATGIPKAKICVTWGPPTSPRVMLLDYNDGTHYTDGWWTSHQGGPTSAWTPDIATGAANGRLIGAGIISCGVAFGDDIVVFTKTQMWRGTFVGPPIVVSWTRISDDIGCMSPYAATVLDGTLYFVGKQGLMMYDGSFPRLMEVPIQQQLRTTINGGNANNNQLIQLQEDRQNRRLVLAMRTGAYTSSQAIATWYSIQIDVGKAGLLPTIATGTTSFQCSLPAKRAAYLVVGAEATLVTDATTPVAAALTDLYGFGLSYMGSNKGNTLLLGVIPRFAAAPSTFKHTDYYGPTMSEALDNTNTPVTVSATPWRADFSQAARWHAPRLHFSSNGTLDPEILDVQVLAQPAGDR